MIRRLHSPPKMVKNVNLISLIPMNEELVMVRYGEIGVKSPAVRRRFEKRLVNNIKSALKCQSTVEQGRIFVQVEDTAEALELLARTFGVVSFSPVVYTDTDFDAIKEELTIYTNELVEEECSRERIPSPSAAAGWVSTTSPARNWRLSPDQWCTELPSPLWIFPILILKYFWR